MVLKHYSVIASGFQLARCLENFWVRQKKLKWHEKLKTSTELLYLVICWAAFPYSVLWYVLVLRLLPFLIRLRFETELAAIYCALVWPGFQLKRFSSILNIFTLLILWREIMRFRLWSVKCSSTKQWSKHLKNQLYLCYMPHPIHNFYILVTGRKKLSFRNILVIIFIAYSYTDLLFSMARFDNFKLW